MLLYRIKDKGRINVLCQITALEVMMEELVEEWWWWWWRSGDGGDESE